MGRFRERMDEDPVVLYKQGAALAWAKIRAPRRRSEANEADGPRRLPAGGLDGGQAGIIRERILFASGQVREQQ